MAEIDLSDFGIIDAQSFWDRLIDPEYKEIKNSHDIYKKLILSILIRSFSDWVFEEFETWFPHDKKPKKPEDFFNTFLKNKCHYFAHITSIANSMKHRNPTNNHIKKIHYARGKGGAGGYNTPVGGYGIGQLAYGSGIKEPRIDVKNSDKQSDSSEDAWLGDVLENVIDFFLQHIPHSGHLRPENVHAVALPEPNNSDTKGD